MKKVYVVTRKSKGDDTQIRFVGSTMEAAFCFIREDIFSKGEMLTDYHVDMIHSTSLRLEDGKCNCYTIHTEPVCSV